VASVGESDGTPPQAVVEPAASLPGSVRTENKVQERDLSYGILRVIEPIFMRRKP
jgi:hypothetical protein